MFSHQHRKAKLLFGLSDIVLVALAFQAAYWTRLSLSLSNTFFFTTERGALILGLCILNWVVVGYWLDVYGNLGAGEPRVVISDALRQSIYGAAGLVLFQFALRLDLSRPFIIFFTLYIWVLLVIFRIGARRLVGMVRREFGALRYVVIVGVSDRAIRLARVLETERDQGVRLRAFFAAGVEDSGAAIESHPVYPLAELPKMLRSEVIDEVLFAVESETLRSLEDVFLQCDEEGVRPRVAVDFFNQG
jgi:FlaA1/EpsC-like NDP-sugar epimerase